MKVRCKKETEKEYNVIGFFTINNPISVTPFLITEPEIHYIFEDIQYREQCTNSIHSTNYKNYDLIDNMIPIDWEIENYTEGLTIPLKYRVILDKNNIGIYQIFAKRSLFEKREELFEIITGYSNKVVQIEESLILMK